MITTPLLIAGCTLAVVYVLFNRAQDWKRGLNSDFQTTLQRLNIQHYEILADTIRPPGRHNVAEVHRILRSLDDQYFLYFYTPGSPGIAQPISKERALVAVKLNR